MTTMSGIHNSDTCTADHGQPCRECARRREDERKQREFDAVLLRCDCPSWWRPPSHGPRHHGSCNKALPAPDPFPLQSPPLRSLTEGQDSAVSNRPLVVSRRQLFEPPLSDDCDFRSLPLLLRAVAAWMKASNVEDPEFDGLTIQQVFPTADEDECRYTAILSYRREGDKLVGGDVAELLEMDAEEIGRVLKERMR